MFQDILIIEDNFGRREFRLDQPSYSIGRSPNCDLRLIAHFIARHHASLVRESLEDGTYYYRIIDSNCNNNGILINGRKLQTHNLENEDQIVFSHEVKATYYRRTLNPQDQAGADCIFDIKLIDPEMIDQEED